MNLLKCDFHIHTTYSDGICSVPEILALYAQHQFDVIAITDHVVDKVLLREFELQGGPRTVIRENFVDYLQDLHQTAQLARESYDLHLIPSIEVTNNTKEYHILAIDVKEWIDPDWTVPQIIAEIQRQEGIAVACHPAPKEGEVLQGPFRHLYNHRQQYKDLFDAWEIANRYHLFPAIGLLKVPYLANSDLHKPEHIFSWKTLLNAEKYNTHSVKQAIRGHSKAIFFHSQVKTNQKD